MRLSQAHFTLLETCPRKFQHTYIEQMGVPLAPEQQERLSWGQQFHWIMQQREIGLPVELLVAEETQLRSWLTAFMEASATILPVGPVAPLFRQSEHLRTLEWAGHVLTVVYDLILLMPEQAQILDWKTYAKPQNSDGLRDHWQTRLYLFALAETSDYRPDQISLTYWFFETASGESPPALQSLKFRYDRTQHAQTQTQLTHLLTQLTTWLSDYEEQGKAFPQVPETLGRCERCPFALRCQRGAFLAESRLLPPLPTLVDIPEIPL
jgi:PD-(D/E)XK nuclease superfamily